MVGLLFLLITLPRFNRNTVLVDRPLNDAAYFIAYVEHFRGETPSTVIRPASNWRMLVPLLAAPLPFSPLTAINVINLCFLAGSIFFLFKSMKHIGVQSVWCWVGVLLFTVSFPTFYYTTIGYVDPGVLFFVITAVYFTLTGQFIGILLSVIIGALAKETIIVAFPFIAVYTWYQNKNTAIGWMLILCVCFLIENILIRKYAYVSAGELNPSFWGFSIDALRLNATRFNSYAAPLLSFGIPGILFLLLQRTPTTTEQNKPLLYAAWMTLAGTLTIFGTTVVATYCDGRIIWLSSGVLIIASMHMLNKRFPI